MKNYRFLDENGTFCLENPENYSYLYFPIAGEKGLKSAITPNLGGDAKLDQNTFILEPVSVENLHNSRSNRNFWCSVKGIGNWSVIGNSAEEIGKRYTDMQDKSELTAGLMWHQISRTSQKYQLKGRMTSFVLQDTNVEVLYVEIKNIGKMKVTFTPTAAIPIYGRSADNIRDHRHVTSLLHRIDTTAYGVEVTPTLSFDERGHRENRMTYVVAGVSESGEMPREFYPVVEDFIGEGGCFERPLAIVAEQEGVKAGCSFEGSEAMGGLRFETVQLNPGETTCYTILIGATENTNEVATWIERFRTKEKTEAEFNNTKAYWLKQVNLEYKTGNKEFDEFMKWVSFQPILRRIYGCSFLPHHDYGKGGRGWRDLWQDCLALLLMNPDGVREMLLHNFAGVRIDGSNATIIGSKPGEFVADRNNITRVWMDHGVWPFMTTLLYINQTGDLGILEKNVAYFKDKQICRGSAIDELWNEEYGCLQKDENGKIYEGTVLEHLLVQNLTAFYEVGEHNMMRLRGADWNDALDMAEERGESVAFTNAYAGNLRDLGRLLLEYQKKSGKERIELNGAIKILLSEGEALYDTVAEKKKVLTAYLSTCQHNVKSQKERISVAELADNLQKKATFLMELIRKQEWVEDCEGNGWFNGYYDNHGRQVEGEFESGVRMMLTGQVFAIMSGTATEMQIPAIVSSADRYLYQEDVGGYRLNTNFYEVKSDLGRMFGFAYGEKENGAVFSHMAVMYANALYKRGFAKEGYKALHALEKQAMNFSVSKIYPGIPEYFNAKGRGLYHYLTGAASWYMLTVITEMYGVRGVFGDLVLEPKLMQEQFDENHCATLQLSFAGKQWKIVYHNEKCLEFGKYRISGVVCENEELMIVSEEKRVTILKEQIQKLSEDKIYEVHVWLKE